MFPPRALAAKMLLCSFIALAFMPSVLAIPQPSFEVIPENVSVNGSFILKVNTGLPGQSVMVRYELTNAFFDMVLYGSVPRLGNKWFCVFSNDADTSSCGPTPFMLRMSDVYPGGVLPTDEECAEDHSSPGCFYVETIDLAGDDNNATRFVPWGNIQLTPEITIEDNNVSIQVSTGGVFADVYFSVYSENLTLFRGYQKMTKLESGFYRGNFEIIPGDYYVAFKAQGASDFGGTVYNLTIPRSAAYQDICPGVTEYEDSVIKVDPVSWNPIINRSKHAEKSDFKITNQGDAILRNLSVEIPEDFAEYISVELASTTLQNKSYVYFTVGIDNVEASTGLNTVAYLVANKTRVASMPIYILVSVRDACEGLELVQAPGSVISFDSYTWEETFLVDSVGTRKFKVKNNGEDELKGFSYVASAAIEGIIENVSFPDRIAPGETKDVTVNVKARKAKVYYGTLIVNTNVGSEKLLLGLTFTEDINSELDALEYNVENLEKYLEDAPSDVTSLLGDIMSKISDAKDSAESGDYGAALESYNEAKLKFDALDKVSAVIAESQEAPAGDGSVVIIIILVIIIVGGAAFCAWYYFTKIKKTAEAFGSESKIKNEDELDF